MAVHMEVKRIRLIDARIDTGYNSQAALAKDAGVAESTVWCAENGRKLEYKSARKILNALKRKGMDGNLTVDDFDWTIED